MIEPSGERLWGRSDGQARDGRGLWALRSWAGLLLGCGLAVWATRACGQTGSATLAIQADQPGAVISANLFGNFFEEINFAGDGGLYAEMVRNRTFDNSAAPDYWTLVTQGTATGQISLDTTHLLNAHRPQCLQLTQASGGGTAGAANSGYWGLSLQAGADYDLSFYACSTNGFAGTINVRLENTNGTTIYAQTNFTGALTTNWQRFQASLAPAASATNARLVVSLAQRSTVWLNVVSLFPHATFANRANGLRADLAGLLAAGKPAFLRYPGGNFIEGDSVANAVRWKNTIGDIAQRPGHWCPWGYWSTDGFGLDEYLQFCADAGMEPLYGLYCGLSLAYGANTTNVVVPLSQMGPYVQDALDLVQYCNGDTNTTWGARRAANGHPAPYGLKYLEIGNENGGTLYDQRYTLFYDALKAAYPELHLVACNFGGAPTSRPMEIADEHYYLPAPVFFSLANHFDSYSRGAQQIFVGEYAVTSAFGTLNNLNSALGEAAFMIGMERNADLVVLASYAPMLANLNGVQWYPDLVYYDASRVVGTPSYYNQRLFAQHRGDVVLPATLSAGPVYVAQVPHGAIGVGSWNTSVQYTNLTVSSNGVVLYQSDFAGAGANGWTAHNGTWSVANGLYQQTDATVTGGNATTGNAAWANYTLSLRARKVSGSEGFLILFNWQDTDHWTWLNLGGWGNTQHAVEQTYGGTKAVVGAAVAGSVQTNQWYDVAVVLAGTNITCYLNGTLVLNVNYPTVVNGGLAASATYAPASGQIIVKAVNPFTTPMPTTINIGGVSAVAASGTLIQLTAGSATAENSLGSPLAVYPTTNTVTGMSTNFTFAFPSNSISVLRLQASGLNTHTNLQLQLAASVGAGGTIAGTVLGWKTGLASPVNLTPNTNYALAWSSSDPTVATVDWRGTVTGVAPGSASIIVSYPALGLAATQSVRVANPTSVLAHRYSFNEAGGTSLADSIGGAAWNGRLPNGGALAGGQLTLSPAASQYVSLPAGIVGSLSNLTLMAWVNLNATATWSRIFDFGNGTTSYLFLTPQTGGTVRFAITTNSNTGEQQINCSSVWSPGVWHQVAVTLSPGQGILYLDGLAVGTNRSLTLSPASLGVTTNNYLGKSQWADPYLDGSLSEFRIYQGALSAAEIAATAALGVDQQLSSNRPAVSVVNTGTNLTLSWPLASAGFTLQWRTNLGLGTWVNITSPAPQIITNLWQTTLPVPTGAGSVFYRLLR